MRKSLAIIASALFLAVAATATHERLRYDSTVFADARVSGGKASQADYPPCVRGVREDRCIQLYERGMRRSYQRWLAARGRGGERVAQAPASSRGYRACRSRNDDRCQQRARTASRATPRNVRTARAATARRAQQVRRQAVTRAAQRPAQTRTASRLPVRAAPADRQRPATAPRGRPGGTPGI